MRPSLSVVVPVHNNAATLAELRTRIVAALDAGARDERPACARLVEIVFVDDASADGSWDVIVALARSDDRIKGLRLPRNLGQGKASLAGLARAQGEWRAVLDADLQDPPEFLPALLAAMAPELGAVFAGRRGVYQSALRMLSGSIARRVRSVLCGVPADAGAFILLRADAVRFMGALPVQHVSLAAMVGLAGVKATSIPAPRAMRAEGESAYSSRARWGAGVQLMRCCVEARWRPRSRSAWDALSEVVAGVQCVGELAAGEGTQSACATAAPH